MHDIKFVLANPNTLITDLLRRDSNTDASDIVTKLLSLDNDRRKAITDAQNVQQQRNAISKEIGDAIKMNDTQKVAQLKLMVANLKENMAMLELVERDAIEDLDATLALIPNSPLADVPVGAGEDDNIIQYSVGTIPTFTDFVPKEHYELFPKYMDFGAASRMSGSRFVVLKGPLARLERALTQFMLDLHVDHHGYQEVAPPFMVRKHALFGTAQLPKFKEDLYNVGNDSWMIPTGEVPLTNIVREQILDTSDLPLRMVAATPCFRSEAGSSGKDVRGLIRQHQFIKVELVTVTTPERSQEELERMTGCAEEVLKKLGLSYQVVLLCTGDMGFASQKTYDIEVWMPGQNKYREISSCSSCGDFQARRMNTRFRANEMESPRFVHTLNGSGVAVGRCLAAVIENYQNADGSITVPEVLRPYMGGCERII